MNMVNESIEGNDGWHLDFVLDDFDEPYFVFDIDDEDFIHREKDEPPPEFDLHLALYILVKEHCPDDMIEKLKQWIRENKLAGGNYPRYTTSIPDKLPDFRNTPKE